MQRHESESLPSDTGASTLELGENPKRLGTYTEPRFLWWQNLARVAESQAIRGFNVFLIVVPFVVTVMESIPGVAALKLPLTWFFGYAAGVCFFLGIVLVGLWCPDINKPRRTFRDIEAEGRTMQYLIQEMRELYMTLAKTAPARANHFLSGVLGSDLYVENVPALNDSLPQSTDERALERETVWTLVDKARFRNNTMQEVFWNVHWYAGNTHPGRRKICFGLFAAGGAFAFSLLLLQCWKVLRSALW